MSEAPTQTGTEPQGGAQPTGEGKGETDPKGQDPKGGAGAGESTDPKDYEQIWNDSAFRNHPRTQELLKASKDLKELKQKQAEAEDKTLAEQKKYKDLADKKANEVKELSKRLEDQTIANALATKLAGKGVVDLDGALKLADRSAIEIGDDGTVSGVDKAIEALQKDKPYLFNTSTGGTPSGVGTPSNPGNGGGSAGETTKFKRSQLQDPKFYQEHREEIIKAQKAGLIEDDLNS